MPTIMEKMMMLTLLIITVNAALMVGLPQIGQDYGSSDLFPWLHPSIAEAGEDAIDRSVNNPDYIDTNVDMSASSITAEATSSEVTQIPMIVAWIPYLGQIWHMINFLINGHVFALQAMGAPPAIQFIVGVPISAIVFITIFFLVLQGIQAIAGRF